ncbi:MAG: hypothetical protein IJO65_05075 [Lachnospiraceae bacterium]|nr:hypothetical protein [Lachnospiraceae bacterium]
MKTKIKKSIEELIFQAFEREQKEVEKQLEEMREAIARGELVVTGKSFMDAILCSSKNTTYYEIDWREIKSRCEDIRGRINRSEPENVEIRFNTMSQLYLNKEKRLVDTYVKIWTMDGMEPLFLFLTNDALINALVFLGGAKKEAFLVFIDDEKTTHYVQLKEFYLLSIIQQEDRSWGLITSYSWFSARVSTNTIQGDALNSVVDLFLADWFRKFVTDKIKTEQEKEGEEDGEE